MTLYTLENARPLGEGHKSPAGSLTDKELLSRLQGYRRTVAGTYKSLLPDEMASRLPNEKMHVSPKIDGELWFLILDKGDALLTNPRGVVIAGNVPLLEEARSLGQRCKGRTVVAGELFAAKKEGRPRVGEVSATLAGEGQAPVERLGFAPFDILLGGDAEAEMPLGTYAEKLELLQRIFDGGKRVKAVRTEVVVKPDGVAKLYAEWVESGKAEGVVARTPARICKIKPSFMIDAVIIGYTERTENPDQVRSLALALMRPGGQFQYVSACGNMNEERRVEFKKILSKKVVQSNWRLSRGDGALFRFVKPEMVVEVKATDVQSEESNGRLLRQMVLSYSDEAGWHAMHKLPCASLLFPVFVRIREDKRVSETDIRIGQVLERCMVPDIDKEATEEALQESTVLRREVYKKESKKGVAVRKLVLWKTNKEIDDPRYPAYVIHLTDYSPGRKEPLKRQVRRAPDEPTATAIAEAMLVENVKKGWHQV